MDKGYQKFISFPYVTKDGGASGVNGLELIPKGPKESTQKFLCMIVLSTQMVNWNNRQSLE